MFDISILISGVRPSNWQAIYNSALGAVGDYAFEMVIVGPYTPEESLKNNSNVLYIQDFGSPTRARQISLIKSKGNYIMSVSDDGLFLPESLSKTMKMIDCNHDKSVICCKYYEGEGEKNRIIHERDIYYYLNTHDALRSPYIDDKWLIYNLVLMKRSYIMDLGGWDCEFEGTAMADSDLAIRSQRDGASVRLTPFVVQACTHSEGNSGDHGPVFYAQTQNDEPLYKKIYNSKNCLNRIKVDLNNWTNSPSKWKRRKF